LPPTTALKGPALKEAQAQQLLDQTRKTIPQQSLEDNTITPGTTPASQSGYVDPTQPYQPIKFGRKKLRQEFQQLLQFLQFLARQ